MKYTKKYLEYLKNLEDKKNLCKPGSYYSLYKQNGEVRDNGAAVMYAKYG